jgi:predicted HTH domain antitoxin
MIVEVQDELLRGLKLSPQRLQLEAASGLYASEAVTLEQAAAIAGISQSEMLHELGRRGVCVHYDVEEFEADLRTLEKLGRIPRR